MKIMADVPLLTWIYVLTTIGSDLETSFREEDHWESKDWFEAAASLGCDVYALNQNGIDHPTGRHHHALWSGTDPHLQSDKKDR